MSTEANTNMNRLSVAKSTLEDRLRGALWAFFAGDALAAPTHWYYGGTRQVIQDYGHEISDYIKPNYNLAGSILNKSDLNGGGRAKGGSKLNKDKTIIGDVINHGKKDLWSPRKSIHYHATLERGENTLEAQLARVLMKSVVQNGGKFDADHFRDAYIKFMTTPGSHNDTYASTCHRMFFENLVHHQLPPEQCPSNDGHNVDVIDGLVLPTIVAMSTSCQNDPESASIAAQCSSVTRRSAIVEEVAGQWAKVVHSALHEDSDESFLETLNSFSRQTIRRLPNARTADSSTMSACYLSQSLPGMLDMIAKYFPKHDPWTALLANANVGGENVHRGSVMGAIYGARTCDSSLPRKLKEGLYHSQELSKEIDDFVHAILPKHEMKDEQKEEL